MFEHNRLNSAHIGGSVPVAESLKYAALLEDERVEDKREFCRFRVYLATREQEANTVSCSCVATGRDVPAFVMRGQRWAKALTDSAVFDRVASASISLRSKARFSSSTVM